MPENYKPGSRAIIFGVIAVAFGVFVLLAAAPFTTMTRGRVRWE